MRRVLAFLAVCVALTGISCLFTGCRSNSDKPATLTPDAALQQMQTGDATPPGAVHFNDKPVSQPTAEDKTNWYIGIQPVDAKMLYQLMPDLKNKPALLEFSSRLCLDCKKMKPLIDKALRDFPAVQLRYFEIQEDKDKFPLVFSTFKPVTAPVFVFINSQGETVNVLYNEQDEAVIISSLKLLTRGKPQ